ncbi:hypothetical protein PACTADRAFT_79680 [Pachysolen tannophilus NRRL Y-2460]|uniref:DNA-directed RNA polymerase III subunit RPC9 n=1 Tax=Pachysolen tannophilus NRRL Y-2460 TaxID=669874 RepID=A0A1E4TZW4_PACTA|nr:hypothetical protein PACTADRAFT_79680 [Pachysolen tannophilus NRRL Y-2460]
MKIEVPRDKLLSNYEVYNHLLDVQKENNWKLDPITKKNLTKTHTSHHSQINLEVITRDLYSYLYNSLKFNVTDNSKQNYEENFIKLIDGLNKFKLMKIEKLQILNLLPRSMVLLYSIVEECDQRFDEDECLNILKVVEDCFPQANADDEEEHQMQDVSGGGEEGSADDEFEEAQESLDHDVSMRDATI